MCQEPSHNGFTCQDCLNDTPLQVVWSVVAYQDAAKELVRRLKFYGAQSAACTMAAKMARLTDAKNVHNVFVVPVPTASSRVRQRGYDQAKLLAKELAHRANLPYLDCLVRLGQTHQVGATREQRQQQLQHAYRLRQSHQLSNASILLVDDVCTTGATLRAAAATIEAGGPASIRAITFAQA